MDEHSDTPLPAAPAAGSIERTLAGQAELNLGDVIREAWQKTDGIKGIVAGGAILAYLAIVALEYFFAAVLGIENASPSGGSAVAQLAIMMILYPFAGGVFMFGLKRSVGEPVHFGLLFSQYGRALPIVAVALLQSFVTGIGFLLLVIPGIYLSIALSLAIPLKVERDLPIFECLGTSLRLVNRKFLEVLMLGLVSAALLVLGVLSLIGWIWTMPWALMIFAITYRQLAGLADGGAPRGNRITAAY